MGNCAKLKWNRRAKGLSQKEFADLVGVSVGTISRLELDESAWLTVRPETEEKIVSQFTSPSSWKLDEKDIHRGLKEIGKELEEKVETEVDDKVITEKTPITIIEPVKVHNGLTKDDEKTLSLIEFAYEGLSQAKTHEDFIANINLIKRIVKGY